MQRKAALNREEKDTHMVTVTATDPSGLSATVNVTIKVTNVNEDPTLTGPASPRVAENTPTATAVATYVAMDDEDDKAGTAIRWTLEGNDDADFSITDGVLRFKSAPNFEAAADQGENNEYNIMVVATDSDDMTVNMDVTVTVTNVDEAGTLTLSTLQPVDGIVVTTTLTDIDVADGTPITADVTWKWAKSSSRTGAYTVIEGETEATYIPEPADINHYLRATATYTDPQGSGKMKMVVSAYKVVVARSTNTPPVFKDADGMEIENGITREVAENTPKGVSVGAPVVATDSEGDVLTYTLVDEDDASPFSIDVATGQLRTSAALNAEGDDTYTVMVKATDPSFTDAADSDTITVTINVTNVDEDPKLTGPASVRVTEATTPENDNSMYVPTMPTYTATDDEDDVEGNNNEVVLTLSGTDAALFGLAEDGELSFTNPPNFEAPKDVGKDNVYNITVVATDSDGQTDEMDVIVTVANVEEDGTVTLSPLQPRIGSPVTASLSDVDGAVSDVKWQWAKSDSADGTYTDIKGATASSYTPVATDDPATTDDGDYLRATARYTDPEGSDTAVSDPGETGFRAVEIDDTNRAPKFADLDLKMDGAQTDLEREIPENTAADTLQNGLAVRVIGDVVRATDPNDDLLTYTLGGTDAASFSILRNTGQLQTKASLNREEQDTHMVTVTATDPSGLSATVNVTIKITNMPEPPVIMVGGLAISGMETVDDYAESGTGAVAMYTASGPDADMAMWTLLEGDDAGQFSIANGMLMFMTAPDYEMPMDMGGDNMYMVTVMAYDGTYMDTQDVTVTVTNVNEMGMVTLPAMQPRVGTAITATLTDPDDGITGTTWQWASSSDMSAWTDIEDDAMSASYTPVDEDASMYLRATAMYTDGEGSGKMAVGMSANMVVHLAISGMSGVEYDENGAEMVATYSASGPDAASVTWTLEGDDAGVFDISSDGVLTFVSAPDYEIPADADMDNTYMVTVIATDSTNTAMHDVTVMVTDVDEMGMVTLSAMQPTVGMEIMATLTDPDMVVDMPTVMWQWASSDAMDGTYTNIEDATSASYTPMDGDANMYLRATAMYTDGYGPDKSEMAVSANMVVGLLISGMSNVGYAENGTGAVATYMASGPDASMATWTLEGDDAGQFSITNGMLMFMNAPDYEMPMDMGGDNMYMVTVMADDGTYMATQDVTVTVTNVDEMGMVTLSLMQPTVGVELTAMLSDLDMAEMDTVTWQWASSDVMDGTYTNIEDATSASYMPVDGDANMYLRATAMYTDGHGPDKSASAVTANMVLAAATGDPLLAKYAGDDGILQRGEVIMAINHYLDGVDGAPSRGDVITIIDLYLGS